jgi:hypothetical protein
VACFPPQLIHSHDLEQKQSQQVTSVLQDICQECSPLSNLAWSAYLYAITADFTENADQSLMNLTSFPIMQFLDHYLLSDYEELENCEVITLDAIDRMLRIQCSIHTYNRHSEKNIHMYALFAACSLRRCDVLTATFFANEASRLIKMSWLSLRLKRSFMIEPMQVADFIVVCQCALLNSDFITAQGMCRKIIDAGSANSYFHHSILHHGHVLKAMTNLIHGTVQSSLFHLECAKAFDTGDGLDVPTFVPEIR